MAKSSGDIEKEFIDGLQSSSGKSLSGWIDSIKKTGIEKRNDIIKWLKTANGFGHMNASLLAGIYFNNGQPVYASDQDLLENQFIRCEEMRPLYNSLVNAIQKQDGEIRIVPKKTYVSITKKKEFAAVNIKPGELRVGMDLGDNPFDERLQKSKLTGPMPRISHMVVLKKETDIDQGLLELMHQADERVNPK